MENDGSLSFPDFPRAELDRSLSELVALAGDVLKTQGRLRALLRANQAIVQQLDLPTVLRRIVDVAVELVGAQYGALGVISPHGGLEQFITVGMSAEQIARMPHPPEGRGILGAIIDDPKSIRLEHMTSDSRSSGFPAGHPPMDSFLGVPVKVRDRVFGNLYLTNSATGKFSADDEELVTALAATAGFAIDNARLFAETQRRQHWSAASAEITARLLSPCVSALTAAATMRSSVTSSPVRISTTCPRDSTTTLSQSPSSSTASEELTTTGVPASETSRRMR